MKKLKYIYKVPKGKGLKLTEEIDKQIIEYGNIPHIIELPVTEYLKLWEHDLIIESRPDSLYYKGIRIIPANNQTD